MNNRPVTIAGPLPGPGPGPGPAATTATEISEEYP